MGTFRNYVWMDIPDIYEEDHGMDCESWNNECFTSMDDEFMTTCEFMRRNKIVELVDTGCDARLPGQCTKNELTSNLKKIKKPNNFIGNKKVHEVGPKATHRSGGDTRITKNPGKKYSPIKEELKKDLKPLRKKSLLNLAISSSTFVVSDRETRRHPTTKFEDFFDDFDDINQRLTERHYKTLRDEHFYDYQEDEIQNRRKFIDRAVDSDCLSNSSKCSIEKKDSGLGIHTELNNEERKVLDDSNAFNTEKKAKRIARTKELSKSPDRGKEEIFSANKSRLKSNRFTSKKTSPLAKNRQGIQKLDSVSRTIIKKKNLKVTREAPEVLKPLKSSIKDEEKDSHVVKKVCFKGSKLPVWQGWDKKSKVTLNVNTAKKQKEIDIEKLEDAIDIAKNSTEKAKATNSRKLKVNRNVYKVEELIEANTEEFHLGKVKDCLGESKLEASVEVPKDDSIELKSEAYVETRKRAENIVIEDCSDNEEIISNEEDKNVKEVVDKPEISAESERSRRTKSTDGSLSELWTENCEKAYARGRAIGLKVNRMAMAAREMRMKDFTKYDLQSNY